MDARTFYDRISGAYDLLADASEDLSRDRGLRLLDVARGERVLEVGFGTGHALAQLADAVGPCGRVVGVDVSSGMLTVARRTVGSTSLCPRFALSDARSLCFSRRVFDAAFMSFTLELFDDAEIPQVLAEIARVLRPGGRLGVVTMDGTGKPNVITELYRWIHDHFPHFVDCRPIDVVKCMRRAGFTMASAQPMAIWGLSVLCAVGRLDA